MVVSGWYLNISEEFEARLSYFTTTPDEAIQVVEEFLASTGGTVSEHRPRKRPKPKRIAAKYGGEELRFRRFLSSYSPIGLDMMLADPLHAKCLCITLRCQLFPEKRPYRPHLEPTMLRQSPAYKAISPSERDRFWEDFEHWPKSSDVEWAHMFVNMVLGFDINEFFCCPPRRPLTLAEINNQLGRLNAGFQIPEGWLPECEGS